MNFPPYPFSTISDADETPIYSFRSISDKKSILKLVLFTKLDEGIYNVALVDVTDDGDISDVVVSNNRDLESVLSTVIQIMLDFFDLNPGTTLSIAGSTPTRTRLYRIVIATYFEELSLTLGIEGLNGLIREPFIPNKPYERFLVRKK